MIYILIALILIFCLFNDYFMGLFNSLDNDKRRMVIIGCIACLVAMGIYHYQESREGFDVIMPDNPTTHIDLKHFFSFVENYQLNTMDPDILNAPVSHSEEEHVLISNNIRNLLNLLDHVSKHDLFKKKCVKERAISIDDHYNNTKIEVNLKALKLFIENDVIIDRPDAQEIQNELIVPMKAIRTIIGKISNTAIYWDYLHNNKFQAKYAGLTLNPHLVKI